MIKNKQDLKYYLNSDRIALRKNYKKPKYKIDIIWKFQILLRKCEYYENCRKDILGSIIGKLYKLKFVILSQKLGLSIPFNVFGPGLAIVHYGTIVVNQHSKIGKNCRIQEGVTIGSNASEPSAPKIGDNVYIGSGSKIIGDIKIADGIVIGANAVVTKSFLTPNVTIAGVPAKVINNNNSDCYITKACK